MANKTITTKIIIRNDVKSNWVNQNPVLSVGEMGIEKDTRKFKFGDGVTSWNSLEYSSATPAILKTTDPVSTDYTYDIGVVWINTNTDKAFILYDNSTNAALWKRVITAEDISGAGDMLKSKFATIDSANGYVDKAKNADKLTTGRTIGITGDVTATGISFDGSNNISLTTVLANVITAGTGCKLTVNSKGLVTNIEALSVNDIPTLSSAKISDLGTSATKNVGVSSGNIVMVNASGKIEESLIPSLAITDVFEANSQTAMLALSNANKGDVCIRSDINKSFILKATGYATLANWVELKTPTDVVLSVNGQTGAITLNTSNISEGTGLYFTEARATANFNTNFAAKSATGLIDGSHILFDTDTLILNGGNA